jgi:hypothetical protein
MRLPRRDQRLFVALCVNAAFLGVIAIALLSRDGRGVTFASPAFGQQQPPVAGGDGGLYVMPAQLSPNTWGCNVLDVDHQSLCVYQYSPGEKMLRLSAARSIRYDRELSNFNTNPSPSEVKEWVRREQEALHTVGGGDNPSPTNNKSTPDTVPAEK